MATNRKVDPVLPPMTTGSGKSEWLGSGDVEVSVSFGPKKEVIQAMLCTCYIDYTSLGYTHSTIYI